MSRFSTIVAAVQAAYPTAGPTTWLVGAQHLGEHRNHTRIVAYTTAGPIVTPDKTASYREDTWLWSREVEAVFSIWAASYAQTENRLHALLVALVSVFGSADDGIGNIREQWYLEGVSGAGCQVDLLCSMTLHVLASDVNVVEDDADPGAGLPTTVPDAITIVGELDSTELPPVILPVA